MQAGLHPFDLNLLSRKIDSARTARGLTWAQISREVGVATSTIRRFATASDAEADGVLALIGWLRIEPEHFIADSKVAGALLAPADEGVIRVDMALIAALPGSPRRAATTMRTTIQRLADVAQASGRTIASLTRWSPT